VEKYHNFHKNWAIAFNGQLSLLDLGGNILDEASGI